MSRGKVAGRRRVIVTSTTLSEPERHTDSGPISVSTATATTSPPKQSYRVYFANRRLPSFEFHDEPYTFAWVRDFAAGIASAVRNLDEAPAEDRSDARKRGERMGWKLKLYAWKWGIKETDLCAVGIEWKRLDGIVTRSYFNEYRNGQAD